MFFNFNMYSGQVQRRNVSDELRKNVILNYDAKKMQDKAFGIGFWLIGCLE